MKNDNKYYINIISTKITQIYSFSNLMDKIRLKMANCEYIFFLLFIIFIILLKSYKHYIYYHAIDFKTGKVNQTHITINHSPAWTIFYNVQSVIFHLQDLN